MDEWTWWSWTYLASEWIIRLGMISAVMRKREPRAAVAWLLVIFFLPWPGLLLYLLIGQERLPARRIELHQRLLDELLALRARFQDHPHLAIKGHSYGLEDRAAFDLAQKLGYMPVLEGNAADLITETSEMVDCLVNDITQAERHVHLLFYIWADDATGRRVAEAVVAAARRGVCCRVLVDAVGSARMLRTMAPAMRLAGVDVRAALPVGLFRRKAARFDLRNHRKIAVIDGRIGHTGSQNIVDAGYGHKDLAWRDLAVRLRGPAVLELQAVFAIDWYFESGELPDTPSEFPEPERAGDVPVQALPSGPSYPTENFQRLVVAALYTARERVVITTPYFVPDEPFLQALEIAVLRGVQVQLIVPRRFDQRLVGAATRSYFEDLFKAKVELYRFEDGLLHSKTMSLDDRVAIIGTSNFDIRSFALNYEVSLLIYSREVAKKLVRIQDGYLAKATRLTEEAWARRPWWLRAWHYVARLLSPVL